MTIGLFGERKYDELKDPPFNRAAVENVLYSNDGRATIVLGGDRNKALDSGYSGLGFPDSSAIDLVCGRGKTIAQEDKNIAISINPDFFSDAARIYISEKTNVDDNFKLTKGSVGKSVAASAIALKADAVRIIGVEGVKVVTRANPSNSRGTEPGVKGIELIAGNDETYLQSMVKGENLVDCLYDITEVMSNIKSQVHSIMNFLDSFVDNYVQHVHSPPGTSPPPTAVGIDILRNIEGIRHSSEDNSYSNDITSIRNNYLKLPTKLDTYILSPYNKTN